MQKRTMRYTCSCRTPQRVTQLTELSRLHRFHTEDRVMQVSIFQLLARFLFPLKLKGNRASKGINNHSPCTVTKKNYDSLTWIYVFSSISNNSPQNCMGAEVGEFHTSEIHLGRNIALIYMVRAKAVPLRATQAIVGRGDIAPTHSRPRH
jgi:hypothetical protein